MSLDGPFRTWSDVRLESVVRTEADSADYYRFMGSRPREQPGSKAEITGRQTHFRFTPHLKRASIRPHKVRREWRGLTFSLVERCS
jgi:hypothetical protein